MAQRQNPSTTISRPSSSSSKNAASRKGEDNDSADEYVELARPSSALAHTASRKSTSRSSVPRVSVTESEGQQSPLSDYMAMDFSKSTPPSSAPIPAALQAVACQIVREAQALPSNGNSVYMDMTYPAGKQTPSSQPASVSDGESYLPMDFTPTPTPKSSRNPSRQSSQVGIFNANVVRIFSNFIGRLLKLSGGFGSCAGGDISSARNGQRDPDAAFRHAVCATFPHGGNTARTVHGDDLQPLGVESESSRIRQVRPHPRP